MQHGSDTRVFQTTVDSSGRVLLPIELRNELHATKGTTLLWVKSPDGLQLRTFEQSLADVQDYYQRLSLAVDIWSEDIIARRKRESSNE